MDLDFTEQMVKKAVDDADSGYPDHSHNKFTTFSLSAGQTAWNPDSYLTHSGHFIGPATVTYTLHLNGEVSASVVTP